MVLKPFSTRAHFLELCFFLGICKQYAGTEVGQTHCTEEMDFFLIKIVHGACDQDQNWGGGRDGQPNPMLPQCLEKQWCGNGCRCIPWG